MAKDISFKLGNSQNIIDLAALYNNVFDLHIDTKELEWRFMKNPYIQDHYLNYIAINDYGNIVGHTAFIPAEFNYNNNYIRGALSVGSMVSSEYTGIFPQLYSELEKILVLDGFDFLYAFPNAKSYPFFSRLFKYKTHYFECLQLSIMEIKGACEKISCRKFKNGVFNLLEEKFLLWRIYKCPINNYETFEDESLRIIYKFYLENEIDLLSIKCKKNHFDVFSFLRFLQSFSTINKVNIYSTNRLFSKALSNLGFKQKSIENKFVCKVINPELSIDKYFLQMIDSDIF